MPSHRRRDDPIDIAPSLEPEYEAIVHAIDDAAVVTPGRPLDSARHPFELFVLICGLVAGIPLILGNARPGSTAALLDPFLLSLWSWTLTVGCAVALVGVFWPGRPETALLVEQIGLVAVGVGVVVFAYGVLASSAGPGRFVPAALTGGFGLACWWRAVQIQLWVRSALRERGMQPCFPRTR